MAGCNNDNEVNSPKTRLEPTTTYIREELIMDFVSSPGSDTCGVGCGLTVVFDSLNGRYKILQSISDTLRNIELWYHRRYKVDVIFYSDSCNCYDLREPIPLGADSSLYSRKLPFVDLLKISELP